MPTLFEHAGDEEAPDGLELDPLPEGLHETCAGERPSPRARS